MLIKNVLINIYLFSLILLISLNNLHSKRPPIKERNFISEAVENQIKFIKNHIKDKQLGEIYESSYPNTLDTTVEYSELNKTKPKPQNETFIITGDIKAMWQRDSTFQLLPYMKYLNDDAKLKQMVQSLMRRQINNLIYDPYANAFNKDNNTTSPWISDKTKMKKGLWERKYELDSVISPLYFACVYYENTKDSSFINRKWFKAIESTLKLVKSQMRGSKEEDDNGGPDYTFQRSYFEPFDSLHQGRGNPANSCGLVKTMFRSSDDSALFPYNIPENAFLSTTFLKLSKMLDDIVNSEKNYLNNLLFSRIGIHLKYSKELLKISNSVRENIYKHGIKTDIQSGDKYFAFEVDCYGNQYFIDDPGYPSLLSLPFFDFIDINDKIYINTRKRIFSEQNAYFFSGKLGKGIGSPHSERYFIWPLAIIMRGLTTENEKEILDCIELLKKSAFKTNFIHESFHVDNALNFTRKWFAWANSFFGLFINHVAEKFPKLILK